MPEWVFQLATLGAGAMAVYVGIRSDLAALRAKVEATNIRLDDHLRGHRAA